MRYNFARDDDGHWFLIPTELNAEFYKLLEEGEDDLWTEFNNKFEKYTSNNPCSYTFENPE